MTRGVSVLLRGVLLLAGLAAGGLALRLLAGGGLRAWLIGGGFGHGPQGVALFACVATLAIAVGVPRQAIAFAAGYAFGAWAGFGLGLLASVLACVADFVWARAVARDWARRRLRGRLARLDGFLAAHPFTATLTLRLLPVGNNLLLNLLGGLSAVGMTSFLAASTLGFVPQTAVFALLGSGVGVGRGVQAAVAVGLFLISAGLGAALLRRSRAAGLASS